MFKNLLTSFLEKKNKNQRFSKFLLLALLSLGVISDSMQAQYSGTISVPSGTNFPTLSALIDSLNLQGLNGALTVNFTAAQTAPTLGYQLGSATLNASMSSTNTLTFNGGTINAYTGGTRTGTAITSGTSSTFGTYDAMFVVRGTDFVRFTSMTFNEDAANTTNASGMENAIAFHNLAGTTGAMDGCQNILITGCTFNMNDFTSSNQYVIYAVNTLYGATANLIWSVNGDRHRDFTINNCTFNNGMSHAFFKGSFDPGSFTYSGAGTIRNVNITNSNFRRIGGNAVQHGGVTLFGVDTFNIANNFFDIDSMSSAFTQGIFNQNCGGFGRVYNNEITFKRNASGTNQLTAIQNTMTGSIGANRPTTTTSLVRRNRLLVGFQNPAVVLNNSGNANIFINAGAQAMDAATFIDFPATCIIDSNTVVNQTFIGTGGINLVQTATFITGQTLIIKDNIFKNIVRNGISGQINGIIAQSNYKNEIYNNIIDSLRVVTASTPTSATAVSINGIVSSNTQTALAGGYGRVFNNRVSNLFINAPNTATTNFITGINVSGFADTVYNNRVHYAEIALQAAGGGSINGLAFPVTAAQGTLNAYGNVVDSLIMRTNGTVTTTGVVSGAILSSTGIVNFYNNFIGELYSPNSSNLNAVIGFSSTSTGSTNLTNNTIQYGRLGAITSNSTTSFGGSGFSFGTGASNVLKNNIINIKGTPGATGGSFTAVRRTTTGTSGVRPANFSGNNNTYHVNTNNNNYIYAEGTTAATLVNAHYINSSATNPVGNFETQASFNSACGVYKRFMLGEVSTFNEDILATAHGSVANAFTPTGSSLSESSGEVVATTALDLAGGSRGANYDRGALQFSGTAIDLSGPVISFTPRGNVNCLNVAVTISADITDFTGVNTTTGTRPRLYYRKTTDPDTFVSANNNTAPGWKWVQAGNTSSPFTFTYDWTKFAAAPVTNDTITYFFSAQDNVGTPNVSINAATLVPSTSCPSSVAIGTTAGLTNATSPYRFIFNPSPTFSFEVAKNPICSGNADTIKANFVPGAMPTATSTTFSTLMGENIFSGGWGGTKSQYILRASELAALGFNAGDITSIGIETGATVGTNYDNFQIWVGHTSQSDMSPAAFIDTALQTKVYEATGTNGSYVLAASSLNTFTFGTTNSPPRGGTPVQSKFSWNGTSNVVLTFAWTTGPGGVWPAASQVKVNATGFNSGMGRQMDNQTMPAMLGATPGTLRTNRPVFTITGNTGPAVNPTTGYTWSPSGLGTAQTIFPFPSTSPISKYKVTVTDVNGCQFNDSVSINVDTLPKRLRVFNSFQCGAGVPPITFKVRDSNGYTLPTIAWYSSAVSTVPLQSSADTVFTSTVGSTTTMFVSVQSPAGCWSPRVPITLTVNISDSILGRANGVRDTIRVCAGSPVNLTAINAQLPTPTKSFDTFTWTSNDPNSGIGSPIKTTNGNHTFTPVIGGNYQLYVNAIDTGSTCSAVDTIKFSVQTNPFAGATKELIAVPNPVCIGNNVNHLFVMSNPTSVLPTGYCASAATSTSDEDIDSVSFGVIQNNTGCPSTLVGSQGTATGTADFYSDFTASTVPVPDVIAGNTYPFNLNMVSCSGNPFTNSAEVYVDWNRDGDFGDSGEEILVWNNINNANINQSINITVPANATLGKTVMRISVRELAATAFSSCHNVANNWGETEDYVINIKAVPTGTTFSWTNNFTGSGTVIGTANPLIHALPAATTIYNLRLTNGVCIDSIKDTIRNNVPAMATTSYSRAYECLFWQSVEIIDQYDRWLYSIYI
jgi:hypothetical protein